MTVANMQAHTIAMKTLILTLAVMLMIPVTALFAQGISKDVIDSTENIPESGWFTPFEVEPTYDMAELYSHLKYPEKARKNKIEGKVTIQFYMNKEGKILKTKIVQSDNPLLEEAAVNAVMQTTFTPAIQGGKAIGVWWTIPVKFSLK